MYRADHSQQDPPGFYQDGTVDRVTRRTIRGNMTIREILALDPDAAEVLWRHGMHCLGCPTAIQETLEEAAAIHGLDLEALIQELEYKRAQRNRSVEARGG